MNFYKYKSIFFIITTIMFGLILSACDFLNLNKNERDNTYADYMQGSLQSRLNAKKQQLGNPIFIRIFKEENELEIWMKPKNSTKFTRFGVYPICKYSGSLGPKFYEGDHQAPEGFYAVSTRLLNPNSQYYRAFNLGYPNKFDKFHGRTGNYLMVHGNCVSIGCYAMTNRQMGEIYQLAEASLKQGQEFFRVQAFPFRMTKTRLEREKNNRHYDFWVQLKAGFDAFERTKIPPNIEVINGRYHVR